MQHSTELSEGSAMYGRLPRGEVEPVSVEPTDPLIASLMSIADAVEARVRPAGWTYQRIPGGVRWVGPDGRMVEVDEVPGDLHPRVVTATNGRDWLTLRVVTADPALVIRTLDDWHVLPGGER